MNVRSILNKLDDLKGLVHEYTPGVNGITESYTHSEVIDAVFAIPGLYSDRERAMGAKESESLILHRTSDHFESIWVLLKQNKVIRH